MADLMMKKMPAIEWQDALPLGNGEIGAMIYGSIQKERILLNHERLFRYQKEPVYDPFYEYLQEVRKLMLEGRYDEGEEYFNEKFKACCKEVYNVDPYQPFAEVYLVRKPDDAFTEYSSTLDFSSAIAKVQWNEKNTRITRESFVSYDTGCICTSMTSSNDKPLDLKVYIGSVPGGEKYLDSSSCVRENCFIFNSSYKDGRKHGAVAFVKTDEGIIEYDNEFISVKQAKKIYVFIRLYIYEDEKKAADRLIKTLKEYDYEQLKKNHVSIWNKLYNTVSLTLGDEPELVSNEEILLEAYQNKKPINLFHTMFNYGKYLFISSSRKNGLPINLQGIWNGSYEPKWDSDIHNDENVQMCYWASLPLGQFESSLALYDYFDSMIPHFRENAKKIYNCRGILVPICMSTHGKISGITGRWQSWISAGGWISSHYYDYWLFTKDDEFLKHRAVRFMKEVVLFYEDFLITDEKGKYVFVPSLSPENVPQHEHASMMCVNATMDVAIAKECITNLINACRYLDIEDVNISKWETMLSKMPEYEINEDKAMKEWLYAGLKDNYYHRHQSHIYPLFPGNEITKESDHVIYDALKTAVDKRLMIGFVQQTGWSYAHMANIYARLEDGQNALECLNYILRSCTGANLFTYHNDWRDQGLTLYWFGKMPPFQIDANLGFTAAIIEMLVFSKDGFLRVLPALPKAWKKGKLLNVSTRCGVKCDIIWEDNKIDVVLCSYENQTVILELPYVPKKLEPENCEVIMQKEDNGHAYYSITLKKDKKGSLKIG
jgi:alpha-L-fucosidase 2